MSPDLIGAAAQLGTQLIGTVGSTIQAGYAKNIADNQLYTQKYMAQDAQKAAYDQAVVGTVSNIGSNRHEKNMAKMAAENKPQNPNLTLYIVLGVVGFLAVGGMFMLIMNQKKK